MALLLPLGPSGVTAVGTEVVDEGFRALIVARARAVKRSNQRLNSPLAPKALHTFTQPLAA